MYKERRRSHGELLEAAMLDELTRYNIIEPILEWPSLVRPNIGQPFFETGTDECQPLDEVAMVRNETQIEQRAFIVEIKAMRAIDWHDWRDHKVIHKEKLLQHRRHIQSANDHGLDGVCIVAVNKDSSEYMIRCFDKEDRIMAGWEYEC